MPRKGLGGRNLGVVSLGDSPLTYPVRLCTHLRAPKTMAQSVPLAQPVPHGETSLKLTP